jgi:hypothetical protein
MKGGSHNYICICRESGSEHGDRNAIVGDEHQLASIGAELSVSGVKVDPAAGRGED